MGASSNSKAWLVIAVVGLAAAASSSEAYVFYAGGRDGWVVDPTESYNHWAERNRFQVNDTIVFRHEEGVSSVLLVTEQDFDTCNTRSPVRRLEAGGGSGSSVFRFDRSGPFFFISSDEYRCQKGQKLYIIVMAVRLAMPPAAPAPGSSPQWTAFPPAPGGGVTAPPPLWASAPAPEYAHAPGMMGTFGVAGNDGTSLSSTLGAPPPTAGAPRLVDEAIVGCVVGVIGALVLCMM